MSLYRQLLLFGTGILCNKLELHFGQAHALFKCLLLQGVVEQEATGGVAAVVGQLWQAQASPSHLLLDAESSWQSATNSIVTSQAHTFTGAEQRP